MDDNFKGWRGSLYLNASIGQIRALIVICGTHTDVCHKKTF